MKRHKIWIVVAGEAYVPEAFDTEAEARSFADNESNECVSGPWAVIVRDGNVLQKPCQHF